ncbi:MAG: septum formation protein Maf [Oscillospiraceae bacterium]|nr:septum formation protein Maf [Oscillospiraceae bacterium]
MILASQSPRRRELLGLITDKFTVIPASGEEKLPAGTSPAEAVKLIARAKAEEIHSHYSTETIVAADTVVCIGGEILGKPRTVEDAFEMLLKLSGKVHSVFTGVCVIFPDGDTRWFAEETRVEFFPLSERLIADYVASGEPMDKAGAYGIQGKGALLVKGITGDYYNVMGLPVGRLYRVLTEKNGGAL